LEQQLQQNEGGGGGGNAKKMKLDNGNNVSGGGSGAVNVHDPSMLLNSNDEQSGTNITMSSSSNNNHTNNNHMEDSPPSNILFADSLPKDCNEMMLACLFRNYPGYKESRIPRQGLAFIEFDDEPHATVALKALNGFNLSATETLNLKYGKA
jgi:RNA recognition motif-containing protein